LNTLNDIIGISFITRSVAETKALAKLFSEHVKTGDIIFLDGDLGSGKTTFVQGLTISLGVKANARSSSFMIVNSYAGRKIKNIYHIDLFRLNNVSISQIGIEECFRPDSVSLIEWPRKLKDGFVKPSWTIHFEFINEGSRKIRIEKNK
jgi:tRNA threonylcarbamoyladenosine biosynthesis protein TsaE